MRGEDGRNWDVPGTANGQSDSRQPLVEVTHDVGFFFKLCHILVILQEKF